MTHRTGGRDKARADMRQDQLALFSNMVTAALTLTAGAQEFLALTLTKVFLGKNGVNLNIFLPRLFGVNVNGSLPQRADALYTEFKGLLTTI